MDLPPASSDDDGAESSHSPGFPIAPNGSLESWEKLMGKPKLAGALIAPKLSQDWIGIGSTRKPHFEEEAKAAKLLEDTLRPSKWRFWASSPNVLTIRNCAANARPVVVGYVPSRTSKRPIESKVDLQGKLSIPEGLGGGFSIGTRYEFDEASMQLVHVPAGSFQTILVKEKMPHLMVLVDFDDGTGGSTGTNGAEGSGVYRLVHNSNVPVKMAFEIQDVDCDPVQQKNAPLVYVHVKGNVVQLFSVNSTTPHPN